MCNAYCVCGCSLSKFIKGALCLAGLLYSQGNGQALLSDHVSADFA